MAVLVDTNILLRSMQPHHPHYVLVERALLALQAQNETLYVTAQDLVEFWAVATRPEKSENGLGMSPDMAAKELAVLKDLFQLLPEPDSVFVEWERLGTTCKVSGKNTHDARLVATMRLHGIEKVLTFNISDFQRFPGVMVLNPAQF